MHRGTGLAGLLLPSFFLLLITVSGAQALTTEECLDCHDLDQATWAASIHAESGMDCTDCHSDREMLPHDEGAALPSCSECHTDVAAAFLDGIHAGVAEEFFSSAGGCPTCHGVHGVLSAENADAPTHSGKVGELCGQCHRDPAIAKDHDIDVRVVQYYEASVHGVRNHEGVHAATCVDCHGAHRTLRASHPDSKINPFRIVDTCGECHAAIAEDYLASIHGRSFERGVTAAPVCTDCHGFHRILETPDSDLVLREGRSARHSCPACHASDAIMGEFGVPVTRVSSYEDSYHGLAQSRGGETVPDCASCHGVHRILPASKEDSRVAAGNLKATCGACHEDANEKFVKTPVHYTEDVAEAGIDVTVTRWVRRVYWVLLIGVLGGMVVHNTIVLSWYVRRRWREERQAPSIRRFRKRERAQHTLLVITFALLVVSGFMLAYPGTWWSRLFSDLGLSEISRQWTHRVPAIALGVMSIYHTWWLVFTGHGRAELGRMRPSLSDLREVVQNMRFHLGQTEHRPAFGKFDYPAKAEYWALIWGTAVMVATGLILWFPELATHWMPGWGLKVAQVIHLYEAWLAALAILIFHFFYVIAHPDTYPINFSMVTGRVPRDHALRVHPKWVEEVESREE